MPVLSASAIMYLFTRCLGSIALLPIGHSFSNYARQMSLAIVGAIYLFPSVNFVGPISICQLGIEFLIGVIVGLPAALLIELAQSYGNMIDTGRGQNFASMYDAIRSTQSNVTGILLSNFVLALLITSGLLVQLLSSVALSCKSLPIGGVGLSHLSDQGQRIIYFLSSVIAGTFSSFIIFAALFLLVDLGVSAISKVLAQAGLNSESFQLKTFAALLLMIALLKLDLGSSLAVLAEPCLDLIELRSR